MASVLASLETSQSSFGSTDGATDRACSDLPTLAGPYKGERVSSSASLLRLSAVSGAIAEVCYADIRV